MKKFKITSWTGKTFVVEAADKLGACVKWSAENKGSWEAMTKIISSFNYDKSESMVDYFDVGFYERWELLPAKKAA